MGRLAFPRFVFLIAYNLTVRCVPARRYLLPLLGFGVVSQLPVMIVLGRGFLPLNILFTLFLGVTFMTVRRYAQRFLPFGLAIFNLVLVWSLLGLFAEYGPVGVLLVPATQVLLARPSLISVALVALLVPAVNLFIPAALVPLALSLLIWGVMKLRLLSLPRSRWLFYGYHPAPLLVLWGVSAAIT